MKLWFGANPPSLPAIASVSENASKTLAGLGFSWVLRCVYSQSKRNTTMTPRSRENQTRPIRLDGDPKIRETQVRMCVYMFASVWQHANNSSCRRGLKRLSVAAFHDAALL